MMQMKRIIYPGWNEFEFTMHRFFEIGMNLMDDLITLYNDDAEDGLE